MKKLINGIVSMLAGGLLYAFYACATVVAKSGSLIRKSSVYDLLKSDTSYLTDATKTYKVFTIIAMVVSGLLVISGLISLLSNLKVIKYIIYICMFYIKSIM